MDEEPTRPKIRQQPCFGWSLGWRLAGSSSRPSAFNLQSLSVLIYTDTTPDTFFCSLIMFATLWYDFSCVPGDPEPCACYAPQKICRSRLVWGAETLRRQWPWEWDVLCVVSHTDSVRPGFGPREDSQSLHSVIVFWCILLCPSHPKHHAFRTFYTWLLQSFFIISEWS